MEHLRWEILKIINVAQELKCTGKTGASTGEQIAAAFVLNNMRYLPADYRDVNAAWKGLSYNWQGFVLTIKENHIHLIN